MQLITHTRPHLLIADEGKRLKQISKATEEELAELIEAGLEPEVVYCTVAFVPDDKTLADCLEDYEEVDLPE